MCKTRLIPALGARGAADLQRQMSEYILKIGGLANCDVLLFVDGGCTADVELWLGSHVEYVLQEGDDLGERMFNGLAVGFAKGYENVVLVGSDCPSLNVEDINHSFTTLSSCDLVFGPSVDGGYYLVGMAEMYPELFINIDWGTPQVLRQSLDCTTDLEVKMLPVLHDVDLPEDLVHVPEFLLVACG